MKTKICTKCSIEKTEEDFSGIRYYSFKKKQVLWRKMAQCKDCMALYKHTYNQINKEHLSCCSKTYQEVNKKSIKAKRKIYNQTHKSKYCLSYAERKARKKELAQLRHEKFVEEFKKQETERIKKLLEQIKKPVLEKRRAAQRLRWEKNRDKYIQLRNTPEAKAKASAYHKTWAKTYPDARIRQLLIQNTILSKEDIPQELIDAKREYLKLTHKLKGEQNEVNQRSQGQTNRFE